MSTILDEEPKEVYRKNARQYRVVFPLWNKPPFLSGLKEIGDVTFSFTPINYSEFYKNILQERDQQQQDPELKMHFTERKLSELNNCSLCIAFVNASLNQEAYEHASEALYEILGLVNMAVSKEWRSSNKGITGKFPVSSVLIGPHITIHNKNGLLSYEGLWFENWSKGPSMPDVNFGEWEKQYNTLANGIKNSPWPEDSKMAAMKYYKAFSNPNLEESFLEGWRLLEFIAGPESKRFKNHNKVERASKAFKEHKIYHIIGKHLQFRRNRITHGQPIEANDDETLAFQMAYFINQFLIFYIRNWDFRSKKEFWNFFDFPIPKEERLEKIEEIKWELYLYEKAALFREDT